MKSIKIRASGLKKDFALSKKMISDALHICAEQISFSKIVSVNLCFVTDRKISSYHADYFNDPSPTDVISFNMDEFDEENNIYHLGDLIISWETAIKESQKRDLALKRELLLYAIHGFLHLVGYEDDTTENRNEMNKIQQKVLREYFNNEN